MQLVVADTGPINYLLLIEQIEILPALFGKVILPSVVRDEMARPKAPLMVRSWIANTPLWVEVRSAAVHFSDASLRRLDAGEGAAISLALEIEADLLLMDDREGGNGWTSEGVHGGWDACCAEYGSTSKVPNLTQSLVLSEKFAERYPIVFFPA